MSEQKGRTHPARFAAPLPRGDVSAPLRGGARGWRKSGLGGSGSQHLTGQVAGVLLVLV